MDHIHQPGPLRQFHALGVVSAWTESASHVQQARFALRAVLRRFLLPVARIHLLGLLLLSRVQAAAFARMAFGPSVPLARSVFLGHLLLWYHRLDRTVSRVHPRRWFVRLEASASTARSAPVHKGSCALQAPRVRRRVLLARCACPTRRLRQHVLRGPCALMASPCRVPLVLFACLAIHRLALGDFFALWPLLLRWHVRKTAALLAALPVLMGAYAVLATVETRLPRVVHVVLDRTVLADLSLLVQPVLFVPLALRLLCLVRLDHILVALGQASALHALRAMQGHTRRRRVLRPQTASAAAVLVLLAMRRTCPPLPVFGAAMTGMLGHRAHRACLDFGVPVAFRTNARCTAFLLLGR